MRDDRKGTEREGKGTERERKGAIFLLTNQTN